MFYALYNINIRNSDKVIFFEFIKNDCSDINNKLKQKKKNIMFVNQYA